MKLPVRRARLIQGKSDEKDLVLLANDMRDALFAAGYARTTPLTTAAGGSGELWRDTLDVNQAAHVTATVVGVSFDGAKAARYVRALGVRRPTSASPAIFSALSSVSDEDDATWNCTLAIDGNDIVLAVTGDASVSVSWYARVQATWAPFQ